MSASVVRSDWFLGPLEKMVACHECDLLMLKITIKCGERVQCPRCGFELYCDRPRMLTRCLALTIASLLLYIPANFLPFMELHLLGQHTKETVWSGVKMLFSTGSPEIALVVVLCSMVVPLVKLLCQLVVLLSIRFDYKRHIGLLLYRIYKDLREWGMLEVYLMGALVSMVKLSALADLTIGVGLSCFIGMLLLQVWLEVTFSPHQVWEALSGQDPYACH